jgi:serine/threonine-protein kinase
MSKLEDGSRFRGLLVQSALGEGAMGTAYLVSHPILRIPLVVKVFKRASSRDLFAEAHLSARVASPHVVPVLDAGVEGDVAFIVQRYVDGIDLRELENRFSRLGRCIPLGAVCRLVVEVARGLHAIHQAGVVHRDVKPANLFLCGSGNAVVGDFGIAVDPAVARGDEMAGTPLFMAPEMWLEEPVDRRTDVYSLGATAFLLATGRLPFDVRGSAALGLAHTSRPLAMPAAATPREAYVFAAIDRTMRKTPGERYPSADALADDLALVADPLPPYAAIATAMASVGSVRVDVEVGDLTAVDADVIVNAANWRMTMTAGVAAALASAGGPSIEEEALAHAPARMGDVVWTGAGTLKAKYVAHAVAALAGSICLQRCMLRVLLDAEARGLTSVAIPALGTGIGEVPMELAASLVLEAIRTFASLEPRHVRVVRVVLVDDAARQRWCSILESHEEMGRG